MVEPMRAPRPPTRINPIIILCPVKLQKLMVSCITSPVPVAAEVAVNIASITETLCPLAVAPGNKRRIVPIKMSARKKPISNHEG